MRLDAALVSQDLVESRTKAQHYIKEGLVKVNQEVITKSSKEIAEGDIIELAIHQKFVSRGGEKLLGVLLDVFNTKEAIAAHLKSKNAIDVGSSTGGFTECLLSFGVVHVTCVDVGTNQLHPSLRNNTSITVYEQTDIRNFTPDKQFDLLVADLSFISLEQVFPKLVTLTTKVGELYLLIKPQFEVGKGNTKKGIVKNEMLVQEVLEKYKTLARTHFSSKSCSVYPSRVQGGDGNQEYFMVIT